MLNIIGGNKKRAKLEVPNNNVRQTSAKKREAIFSILESIAIKNKTNLYKNKYVIDFFSGTGSLGLEALSRGAKYSYFYEKDKEVCKILKKNCLKICPKTKFKIINKDIFLSNFDEVKHPISIIFLDPPYKCLNLNKILKNIYSSGFATNKTMIVIETARRTKIDLPTKIITCDERYYSNTKITFALINIK